MRLGTWRFAGTSIRFLPDRYCPVSERGAFRMSASVPCATTSPPCTPAPGPMSTTWSARRIASSSCSTTITVLPRSRRRVRVPSRRSLSRWCRPMLGSSSTYITPTRPAPICEARRMRCASPPDRRVGLAFQGQVVEADIDQEAQPLADFLDDLGRDLAAPAGQLQRMEERQAVVDRHHRDLVQRAVGHEHVARGAVQARAAALGAGAFADVLRQLLAHRRRFGFAVAAFEVRDDAFEGMLALVLVAVLADVDEVDRFLAAAVQDDRADRLPAAVATAGRRRICSASPATVIIEK